MAEHDQRLLLAECIEAYLNLDDQLDELALALFDAPSLKALGLED